MNFLRARRQPSVFLAWAAQNGRTRDLARALDIPPHFLGRGLHGLPVLVRYLVQSVRSLSLLVRTRPRSIIVMQPPLPLLVLSKAWCWLTNAKLVGDLHTGIFNDPKWTWSRRATLRLLKGETAIVTNERLRIICDAAGVTRTLVLHDYLGEEVTRRPDHSIQPSTVIAPVSYANDEPISEILEAAALLPTVTWLLTGTASHRFIESAPVNVQFTGFVDDTAYQTLLANAGLVLALVTRDDTMQRAGYEAMLTGKALVTSNWPLLRNFFGDAAVFTESSPNNIAEAVARGLNGRTTLEQRMQYQREVRAMEQDEQLGSLAQIIQHRATT